MSLTSEQVSLQLLNETLGGGHNTSGVAPSTFVEINLRAADTKAAKRSAKSRSKSRRQKPVGINIAGSGNVQKLVKQGNADLKGFFANGAS